MSVQFQTREQRYASAVYAQVQTRIEKRIEEIDNQKVKEAAKEDPATDKYLKAYGALAHKLPILIRQSGLVQALAFVQARNMLNKDNNQALAKIARNQLIQDLTNILQSEEIRIISNNQAPLVDQAMKASFDEYMRLTEACMEALLWFKRFATSELGVEQGMEADDE